MTDLFLTVFEISASLSPVIAALLLLTPLLNRRYAAKWSYWIWIFLAVRLVLPVHGADVRTALDGLSQMAAQTIFHSEGRSPDAPFRQTAPPKQAGQIVVEIPAQMTAPVTIQSEEGRLPFTPLDLIAFVWLTGSFLFLSVHFRSFRHYQKQVLKNGTVIKNNIISEQVSALKQELHIRNTVCVLKCAEAASPMIIGFRKPVLILPGELFSQGESFFQEESFSQEESFPPEELIFILRHELIHLKRKDVYKKLLFVLANAIHWFNPLIWMMQREAAVTMELSCDERVTQDMDYAVRKAYTEALLSALHRHCTARTALSTQFYGGKQIMKVRFKNILSHTRKKNGSIVLICAVVLTVSLGALVGCSLPMATAGNNALPLFPAAIPQDGQIYGYLPKLENGIATIDRQLWLTPESGDWKPEYNDAAGFEVVDAEGGDITYPLHENCTFSILENHHDPRLELNAEEFLTALSDMEYPVLWIIQLENGQIMDISEQYRP
ncbi:MAG TPA: hypothetical protein DCZ91_23340 [Lachnospiraceae bacterium]|nr:hypothetical protein [Lachnospiraceae bacterium]